MWDRVAIVIGSTKGMGRAMTVANANEGARAMMCGRGEYVAKGLGGELTQECKQAAPIRPNLSSNLSVSGVVVEVAGQLGRFVATNPTGASFYLWAEAG